MRLERAEIDFHVRHRSHENRNFFPRLNSPGGFPLLQQTRHGLGLHFTAFRSPHPSFRSDVGYTQERDIRPRFKNVFIRKPNAVRKVDPWIGDLTDLSRPIHHDLRKPVRKLRNRRSRAIMILEMFKAPALVEYAVKHTKENRHTSPAKPVNRLLGVTDDHQLARSKAAGVIRIFGE